MNYFEDHIGDYAAATAHLSWDEDMAYTRLIRAYYHHEKPIPKDFKQACRLARAQTKKQCDAVQVVLEEFFSLEEDGWHQKRCDEEITRYLAKKPQQEEKRENDKERQRRARERRKQLFTELSDRGIHMPWNTTTEQLQTELSRITALTSHAPVTEPVTRDNTATHTPDPINQTPVILDKGLDNLTIGEPLSLTPGEVCKAFVEVGMTTCNHSSPALIKLVAAGASLGEFVNAAQEAKVKGKLNFNYVLAIVSNQREAAKKLDLHQGAMPSSSKEAGRQIAASSIFKPEHTRHLQSEKPTEAEYVQIK